VNGAVQSPQDGGEAARPPTIGFAWRRIPARVIVRDDDTSASALEDIGDDLLDRETHVEAIAVVLRKAKTSTGFIHVDRAECLIVVSLPRKPRVKELPRRLRACDL
jgi:hypothetical protein